MTENRDRGIYAQGIWSEECSVPDEGVMQVTPRVKLLAHSPDALKTVNIAARRCYSPLDNDELIESVDDLSGQEMERFITGIMKTGHTSVVEHALFTFMIEGVSIVTLKQATRMRLASYSVQSERYVDLDLGFAYVMPVTIMDLGDEAMADYAAQMCTMHEWYKGWREKGIPAEDARYVLPQATETKLVLSMNIRELLLFFSLRCCERAQWEIRHMAMDMLWECQSVLPEIFGKAGPSCVATGRCPEGKRSCGKCDEIRKEYAALFEMNRAVCGAGHGAADGGGR